MIPKVSTLCKMEYSLKVGKAASLKISTLCKMEYSPKVGKATSLKISTLCKMEYSFTGWESNDSEGFYSVQNGIQSHRWAKQRV
jgi:hypothetical protein